MTGLVRRYAVVSLLVLLVVVTAGAVMATKNHPKNTIHIDKDVYCLQVSDSASCTFRLERATTDQQRIQGLSGRDRLANDVGMLFDFANEDTHCMWMKDMKFSLDMVWLDAHKKVTHIAQHVSPGTYPESFCGLGRYVLEVNAGLAEQRGIRVGKTVSFSQ